MSDWYRTRTWASSDWPLSRVEELKADASVAVVVPARNEERTVGSVIGPIAQELPGLVDELIVMDSLSTDDTAGRAAAAGARVESVADVRPDLGVRAGKGEALWKSLFVTTADVLVFVDADLTEWGPHFVTGLVGPLLADPSLKLVRGFYDRVLDNGITRSLEGGRVTELVARPWIALNRPELARVVQPLAGEWSIRRSTFEALPVPVGYGVELSTLLDVHAAHGLMAIAQVDLGRRAHRHQNLHDLTAMATELMAVADRRRTCPSDPSSDGVNRAACAAEFAELRLPMPDRTWSNREVALMERPPVNNVIGYDETSRTRWPWTSSAVRAAGMYSKFPPAGSARGRGPTDTMRD